MSAKFTLPRIYPITDRRISGISHTEQTELLIAGGAQIVQLREKYEPSSVFYDDARTAVEIARNNGVRIIINDRVDIALAVGADGVHLGQDDLPPVEARKLLGPNAIIGYSTHSLTQAREAIGLPIEYIAIGPVYPTGSKENADPVIGVNGIRAAKQAVGDLPLVAIGGITRSNISDTFAVGADAAAMIREIIEVPDEIVRRMRKLVNA